MGYAIAAAAQSRGAKVVLISGFLEPEIRTKLLEAGAEGFIQKPFKPNEILGLIRQVIDIAKR